MHARCRQRALSRCQQGSNTHKKRKATLVRCCYRGALKHRQALHRLTTTIVREHGKWIAIEELKIQNMTAHGGAHKKGLNRSILAQNWCAFTAQLNYKAESVRGELVKVNPKNTTQQCSFCGALPRIRMTLADRWYHCQACGHAGDRDLNAAKNIAQRGVEALL